MHRPTLPSAPPEQPQLGAMHYLVALDLAAHAVPAAGPLPAVRLMYELVNHQPPYARLALAPLAQPVDGQTHTLLVYGTEAGTNAALDFFKDRSYRLQPESQDPEELVANYAAFCAEATGLKPLGLTGFLDICAKLPDFRRRWATNLPDNYLLPYQSEN